MRLTSQRGLLLGTESEERSDHVPPPWGQEGDFVTLHLRQCGSVLPVSGWNQAKLTWCNDTPNRESEDNWGQPKSSSTGPWEPSRL